MTVYLSILIIISILLGLTILIGWLMLKNAPYQDDITGEFYKFSEKEEPEYVTYASTDVICVHCLSRGRRIHYKKLQGLLCPRCGVVWQNEEKK